MELLKLASHYTVIVAGLQRFEWMEKKKKLDHE